MAISAARRVRGGLAVLMLGCLVCSFADQGVGHPADNPSWFDVSPLDHDDVHMLAAEATQYAKEGEKQQESAEKADAAAAKRKEQLAEEQAKNMLAPTRDPETTSSKLAKIQQKLALTLVALDDCNANLRKCLANTDVKATGASSDANHQAPVRLGEPMDPLYDAPTTTAQEDWDATYHNQSPPDHAWKSDKVVDTKETAVQEYHDMQKHMPGDDEPGYKLPQDRLFASDVKELAQQANETRKVAVAALQKTSAEDQKLVEASDQNSADASGNAGKAAKAVAASSKVPQEKDEMAAVVNADKNLAKCKADLQKCDGRDH